MALATFKVKTTIQKKFITMKNQSIWGILKSKKSFGTNFLKLDYFC